MGLLNLEKTASQSIYEATCLELVRGLSKDLAEDKPTTESFTSINGLDKSVQEINFTKGIKTLFQKYHNPKVYYSETDNEIKKVKRWKNFKNDIEILKLGNYDMSINQAMEIAGNMYAEVGHEFYGMLLTTEGNKRDRTIFNPLHPILVAELNKEDASFNLEEKIWSAAIYVFKEGQSKLYDPARNKTNYIDEIAAVVTSINSPANYIIENSNFNVDIVNDKFVLNYEETKRERNSGEKISEDASGERNYIIPGQIINISGVAYPYYGVVYSRKGLAWNLTPAYHANINHPRGQSMDNGMEGGSRICTHSGNSKTQMGLSSLNHCNTTSPLNSHLCQEGFMTYSEQSLKASLEMFLGNAFKEHGAVAERVLTFQEFIAENDGNGTKKDYLKYIKNRLDSKMDEEIKPEEVVAEQKDIYTNTNWKSRRYRRGDITYDTLGVDPRVFNGSYEGSYSWITITSEKGIAIIAEDRYPEFDSQIEYVEADIVWDKFLRQNEYGGLRIMIDGDWTDYIEEPTETNIQETEVELGTVIMGQPPIDLYTIPTEATNETIGEL
ncbi:MAG: hypothetical protein ACTSWQ_09720 [Candidatus Thorarchaeota archaeon]